MNIYSFDVEVLKLNIKIPPTKENIINRNRTI